MELQPQSLSKTTFTPSEGLQKPLKNKIDKNVKNHHWGLFLFLNL